MLRYFDMKALFKNRLAAFLHDKIDPALQKGDIFRLSAVYEYLIHL